MEVRQGTWVSDIVNSSCNDHAQELHVAQLAAELVVYQDAAQGLRNIGRMYAVVVGVPGVVGLLNLLWARQDRSKLLTET